MKVVANGASPTKRGRRTRAQMDDVRAAILDVVGADPPMTVRQVFYQLVTRGSISKTEAEYKHTVCRLLAEMRRSGNIPFEWIADNSRWMRKPSSYSSLEEMLAQVRRTYRRGLWETQDAYVEVWIEKEALAGVVLSVTADWDVPLMVTRGYPSLSFLWQAAQSVPDDKEGILYYFGDYDPSGVDIPRFVKEQLFEFGAFVSFKREAVTPEQIAEYALPTRPTKQADTRSKNFKGESVELDAFTSAQLRELVKTSITQHLDQETLTRTYEAENAERDTLDTFLKEWTGRCDS